jgi:hypothetical protein
MNKSIGDIGGHDMQFSHHSDTNDDGNMQIEGNGIRHDNE